MWGNIQIFKSQIQVPGIVKNLEPSLDFNTYGLLTKCEVMMAGYWPNSFYACLWTET